MMYVGVVHRDDVNVFGRKGIGLESLVIEDYISSERTFKFTYFNDNEDVFILEERKVFLLLQDLKEMELMHEEISLEKGTKTLTLHEIGMLRRYIQRIATDVNFYWEEYIVAVRLDVEMEMLDI